MEIDPNGREMFVVIPRERKMVAAPAIYDGMLRLSFLLEACQPGTIPDANLIAGVLDLVRAPGEPGARVQRRSIIMPSCPARARS